MNEDKVVDNQQNIITDENLDILIPHEVTLDEMKKIRDSYYLSSSTGKLSPKIAFVAMYDFFHENNFDENIMRKYSHTFWPLFVDIGWNLLVGMKAEILVDFVSYTLPFATSAFIDIDDKLLEMFASKNYDQAEDLYKKIKNKMLSIDYPIAFNDIGEKLKVSDLRLLLNKKDDGANVSSYKVFEDTQKALFYDIVLDNFNLLDEVDMEKEDQTSVIIPFSERLIENKSNFAIWINKPEALRSLLTWLQSFENKVKARQELEKLLQTELGNNGLQNIEIALAIVNLDEFLNKNNYPGEDMVHYDESMGNFKWGK